MLMTDFIIFNLPMLCDRQNADFLSHDAYGARTVQCTWSDNARLKFFEFTMRTMHRVCPSVQKLIVFDIDFLFRPNGTQVEGDELIAGIGHLKRTESSHEIAFRH